MPYGKDMGEGEDLLRVTEMCQSLATAVQWCCANRIYGLPILEM